MDTTTLMGRMMKLIVAASGALVVCACSGANADETPESTAHAASALTINGVEVKAHLLVNDSHDPVFMMCGAVRITVALDTGWQVGAPADWWVVRTTGPTSYSCLQPDQVTWVPCLNNNLLYGPVAQAPLQTLLPYNIPPGVFPRGNYTVYFGVDPQPDKSLDATGVANGAFDGVQLNVGCTDHGGGNNAG